MGRVGSVMAHDQAFCTMRPGVMLINTGLGALIDSGAQITPLKCGKVGSAGLTSFPNVIITSHQTFLTREALQETARTTFGNIRDFEVDRQPLIEVSAETHVRSRS